MIDPRLRCEVLASSRDRSSGSVRGAREQLGPTLGVVLDAREQSRSTLGVVSRAREQSGSTLGVVLSAREQSGSTLGIGSRCSRAVGIDPRCSFARSRAVGVDPRCRIGGQAVARRWVGGPAGLPDAHGGVGVPDRGPSSAERCWDFPQILQTRCISRRVISLCRPTGSATTRVSPRRNLARDVRLAAFPGTVARAVAVEL